MTETLLYEKTSEGLAWITLNRPDVLNAINMQMRDELWDLMHAVRDDPDVRVVIFKGVGNRAFSAGADISEFGTAPSYVEARGALVRRVVPRDRLYREAEALARKVLAQPAQAVRLAKRAVVEGIELPLAQGLALESRLATQAAMR